jgi:hypothetical protein
VDVRRGDEVEFVTELSAVEHAGLDEEAVEDEPEVGEARGEQDGEGEEVGRLRGGVVGDDVVVAGGGAVEVNFQVEKLAGGGEGLGEGVVGASGPGLVATAVFDRGLCVGLGFHQGVEGAQFPFGAEARAGEEEAIARWAATAARAVGDGGEGASHTIMVGDAKISAYMQRGRRDVRTTKKKKSRGGVVPRLRPRSESLRDP